jgi:hypothetical protein
VSARLVIDDVTEYQSSACACEQEREKRTPCCRVRMQKGLLRVSNAMNIRYHLYMKSNYLLYI